MYAKIFSKILDSSIWLEPHPTRIVWLTLLVSMDEDGFAQFAALANLARRAVVSLEEAETAVKTLESPDINSSDTDNQGRRVERVPGGWMVLSSKKYREISNRIQNLEETRLRVAKHRELKKLRLKQSQSVTKCNAGNVTSEYEYESEYASEEGNAKGGGSSPKAKPPSYPAGFNLFWKAYPRKQGKEDAVKSWILLKPDTDLIQRILADIAARCRTEDWTKDNGQFIPHAPTYLNGKRWQDEASTKLSKAKVELSDAEILAKAVGR